MGNNLRQIVADNIRLLRKQAGLTQEKLAELSGLHRTYIGSVERAERNISVDAIESISDALGVPASDLLRRGRHE